MPFLCSSLLILLATCLCTSINTSLFLSPSLSPPLSLSLSPSLSFFSPTVSSTPFATGPEDNAEKILTRIGEGKVNLSGGNWDSISKGAKDLVLRMLNIDPSQRYSAAQVLNHSWISSRESLPDIKLSIRDTKIKVYINNYYDIMITLVLVSMLCCGNINFVVNIFIA